MARKSKKISMEVTEPVCKDIYKVAVYIRLSIEEKRDRKDSDSLEHQKNIIYEYIKEHSDMKIYAVYCDNGETGTNFDRPEFQRMMYDIYNGNVNCVIVKDLSRFGREYIEAGEYLERIFPLIGVRFIAINDHYDNKVQTNDIVLPIKNIINTLYAKDMSKKSAAALRIKQANGEFIGSYAAYGYLKSLDDKHKLIIDEEAAPIVKMIFEWKAEGLSFASICRKLYDMKIKPPCKYRFDKGIVKDKRYENIVIWSETTLKSILKNEVYIGNLTQGRRKSHFYEGKKEERVDRDDWIVVKNTHEPIVSKELFDKVQKLMNEKTKAYYDKLGKYNKISNNENIFKSKIVCGDCGKKLVRYKTAKETYKKAVYSYICPTHTKIPDKCEFISINEDLLKDIVMQSVKIQITHLNKLESALQNAADRPETKKKQFEIAKNMGSVYANISYLKESRIRLISDYAKNLLDDEDYDSAKDELDNSLKVELEKLETLKSKQTTFNKIFSKNTWICELKKYKSFKKLNLEIVNAFVERIEVYPDKRIEIQWKFSHDYAELACLLKEGAHIEG